MTMSPVIGHPLLEDSPESTFMKDAIPGEAYETGSQAMQKEDAPDTLGKFNPGLGAQDFSLFESAKFIPKGSDLVFNMHYSAAGKATTDRSRVGLVFVKNPPKLRYFMHNGPTGGNLAIPPRDPRGCCLQSGTGRWIQSRPSDLVRSGSHSGDYRNATTMPLSVAQGVSLPARFTLNTPFVEDLAQPQQPCTQVSHRDSFAEARKRATILVVRSHSLASRSSFLRPARVSL